MTLLMPDSITPANLPGGYPAYLGYVDGSWPTAAAVRAAHPGARVLTLTVLGGSTAADGCDRETGDLSAASTAVWLHARLIAGAWKPVLYCSRDNVPAVLHELAALGVARGQIRILTAHYEQGIHICGKTTCDASFEADGTQYTDDFPGVNGAAVDMSVLAADFFSTAPAIPSEEDDMISGQVTTQAHIPFPAGSFRRIMMFRDFVTAANPAKVRVAAHSLAKGWTVADKTITAASPVSVEFAEADVNAVSVSLLDGSAVPVGYTLAAS